MFIQNIFDKYSIILFRIKYMMQVIKVLVKMADLLLLHTNIILVI